MTLNLNPPTVLPQAEDLGELTKELQLLHVTKEFQQAAKNGRVRDVTKDIIMLHKLIKNKTENQEKKVAELRAAQDKVRSTIQARTMQAEAANSQLSSLAADLQVC